MFFSRFLVIIINSRACCILTAQYPNNGSTFLAFLKLTIIYDEIASKNAKGNVELRMWFNNETMDRKVWQNNSWS